MKTNVNAILIHENDNVVTVLSDIGKGSAVSFRKDDEIVEFNVFENIPVFHKAAVTDIERNAPVIKYGQVIGKAVTDIPRGSHVHDHNIVSPER